MDLVRYCFISVMRAFRKVDCKFTFLLDKPNTELIDLVNTCDRDYKISTSNIPDWSEANKQTFHKQLDIAEKCLDKVFFLEDDYYILPKAGPIIHDMLDNCDFLTPYDHPGYYTEETHNYKRDVIFENGRHWQTVISTCLTFGTHSSIIRCEKKRMKEYGWSDHPMWCDLTKDYKLYSPIPSLATHMETEFLSFGINWKWTH
jgi:hypothetical protein